MKTEKFRIKVYSNSKKKVKPDSYMQTAILFTNISHILIQVNRHISTETLLSNKHLSRHDT